MVEDPVQHGSCKHWIPHHLCPVNDLLIGGKDDGAGFIGVADKGKKAVRLSTADWCVTDLINNDKLCLSDIFQAESCSPLSFCSIEDTDQVRHLFKTYRITAVDSLQAQTAGYHVQIASLDGHLCHIWRPACDLNGGQPRTH